MPIRLIHKTMSGSYSTKIGEFNELRTKSGEFWLRGGYDNQRTECKGTKTEVEKISEKAGEEKC